jgi:hypothetical protein
VPNKSIQRRLRRSPSLHPIPLARPADLRRWTEFKYGSRSDIGPRVANTMNAIVPHLVRVVVMAIGGTLCIMSDIKSLGWVGLVVMGISIIYLSGVIIDHMNSRGKR